MHTRHFVRSLLSKVLQTHDGDTLLLATSEALALLHLWELQFASSACPPEVFSTKVLMERVDSSQFRSRSAVRCKCSMATLSP
ncbi:hypothetical protein PC116_g11456 [Phytophthora cactorum]|nr:hypothetical protein PC120_g7313 [Phytophthora cactorum]KAG3024635.1 hypothetical protein PC119_g8408 [Phytophthora cactorum]KAG4240583.1 hypothetical protein PC116_g11456 [Phytophthora cactorum]